MNANFGIKILFRYGVFLSLYGVCLLLSGCQSQGAGELSAEEDTTESDTIQKYTHTDIAMGTIITEVMYGGSESFAVGGIGRLRELEESLLSWRVENSEIYNINAAAGSDKYTQVSTELAEYLTQILKISADSHGALDPTIGKITRLWDIGGENPQIPEENELQALLAHVGYENIELNGGNQVKLPENVSIDLGAIGKGIGADIMKIYMEENDEVEAGVISIGGSIVTYGTKPDNTAWKVAITDPGGDPGELATLELYGENYVSTSGNYEKVFTQNGVTYHHILDPETGYPAQSEIISVSIVCDSGLISDALSTACFILGYEESLKLLEKYNADAVFVDDDYNIYVSQGLINRISISKEAYTIHMIE